MLSVRDDNFTNLLLTITDAIMETSTSQPQIQSLSHVRKIYDELQALWMCIMSSEHMAAPLKEKLKSFLVNLNQLPSYPREKAEDVKSEHLLQPALHVEEKGNFNTLLAHLGSHETDFYYDLPLF